MLKVCKNDKQMVLDRIQEKKIDCISQSTSNLIDDIILLMNNEGILNCLKDVFPEKRKSNSFVPLHFIMTLAIASKMKNRMSLTDIPFAIQDHRVLAELGYAAYETNQLSGWMTEGTIRHWIGKYNSNDFFDYYNKTVKEIFNLRDIKPMIHILDCTKIAVNFTNENYESATISIDRQGNKMRGYKLASLRGVVDDVGVVEEVRFGTASTHDLTLSIEMVKYSDHLNEGDIIIMDRGFISRDLINYLKLKRHVDTYIPAKKGMEIYDIAVGIAESEDDWHKHPTRNNQMICHVNHLGNYWRDSDDDVDLNSCVVWDEEKHKYYVFLTTDMSKSAKEIILTYQLRPEIEEDFRQIKDFWKIEDFKSTKLKVISFHIVCVLFGYLFYQLYLLTSEGEKYTGKCLPVILKNYQRKYRSYLIIYSGDYFCIMRLKEFLKYRDNCSEDIKEYLLEFIK